jgi:N-acetyl-anhydromuramyl-L-alanine amidase AmpD
MTHIAGNRRQGDPGQLGPWKEILELDRFFTLEKPSIRFIQYFVYNMTYRLLPITEQ